MESFLISHSSWPQIGGPSVIWLLLLSNEATIQQVVLESLIQKMRKLFNGLTSTRTAYVLSCLFSNQWQTTFLGLKHSFISPQQSCTVRKLRHRVFQQAVQVSCVRSSLSYAFLKFLPDSAHRRGLRAQNLLWDALGKRKLSIRKTHLFRVLFGLQNLHSVVIIAFYLKNPLSASMTKCSFFLHISPAS